MRTGRDGRSNVDVFTMANKWSLQVASEVMNTMAIDEARSLLIDRYIMLEKMAADNPSSFAPRTHYFGIISNFVTSEEEQDKEQEQNQEEGRKLITCKFFNQSGEFDGAPSDEDASQLWIMPEIGTHYQEDGVEYTLVEYVLPILSCALVVKKPTAPTAASASACTSPGLFINLNMFLVMSKQFISVSQQEPQRTSQRHQSNKVAVKAVPKAMPAVPAVSKKGKRRQKLAKLPNVVSSLVRPPITPLAADHSRRTVFSLFRPSSNLLRTRKVSQFFSNTPVFFNTPMLEFCLSLFFF